MRMEKSARDLVLRQTKMMSKLLKGGLQGLWDVCLGELRVILACFPRNDNACEEGPRYYLKTLEREWVGFQER